MATNTFERKIEITDTESLKKLVKLMASESPKQPLSNHPFSTADRDRSEDLLKQFLSHSNH